MTIDKKKEGNQMILKVSGRLDTMTAPELETTIKENLEGTTALVRTPCRPWSPQGYGRRRRVFSEKSLQRRKRDL